MSIVVKEGVETKSRATWKRKGNFETALRYFEAGDRYRWFESESQISHCHPQMYELCWESPGMVFVLRTAGNRKRSTNPVSPMVVLGIGTSDGMQAGAGCGALAALRHTPRGPGPKSVRQGADRAQSGLLSRVYENAELLFRDRVLGDVRRIDRERRQQRLRACAPCSLASLVPQARAVLPKTICRQVGLTDKSLTILPELPSCRPSAKKNASESAAGARISTQTAHPR